MRLFYKLILLVSMTAMVSALAIAGVLAWNLGRGFSEYPYACDAAMLEGFVIEFEGRLNALAATQGKTQVAKYLRRRSSKWCEMAELGNFHLVMSRRLQA